MFCEFTLEEIDLLVIQLRKILFDNYQEVKKFEKENPNYVPNHPSGNWHVWETQQKVKILSKYGDLHHVRKFIEAVTNSNFESAENYYIDTIGVYHAYNTGKSLKAVELHDKLEDENPQYGDTNDLPEEFKSIIGTVLQSPKS